MCRGNEDGMGEGEEVVACLIVRTEEAIYPVYCPRVIVSNVNHYVWVSRKMLGFSYRGNGPTI